MSFKVIVADPALVSLTRGQRAYRSNPEKRKEYSRKWHADNKEYALERNRIWIAKNKDKVSASSKKYAETASGRTKHLLKSARRRAQDAGLEFSITIDDIRPIIEAGVCEATGLFFDLSKPDGRRASPRAPSIDRVDPSVGYTKNNTKVVVWQYNAAKQEFSVEHLVELAEAIVSRKTP